MRVYVPATFARAADLLGSGSMPAPVDAFAVTPALRSWVGGSGPSDDEELELVALCEAARGSLRLLASAPELAARRLVLVADVPDHHVSVDDGSDLFGPGQVTVTAAVPLTSIRAVHVDEPDAALEVAGGAEAVLAADGGDAGAEALVATLEARELLWYAPHELPALVHPPA